MPTIGSAPNGENTSMDGTEKVPQSGSKFFKISTLAAYLATLAQTLTNKTLTAPTIVDFTNMNHTHAGASQGGLLTINYNYLINGGFDFAQRQAPGTLTTYATGTYSADRWRGYTENASYQYQRQDGTAENGLTSKYFGAFKKITNTGKMFFFQIVEGVNTVPLRSKTVIFTCRMKASSSKTVRMGIFELQNAGTIDTIPNPIITAAGANSTDPTMGANVAIITAAESKSVTTAMQNFSVSVTVPTNSKNLICAVWTDSQFAANDILYTAEAGLYISAVNQIWQPRLFTHELLLCQRFYWSSFPVDVAPATGSGTNVGALRFIAGKAGAAAELGFFLLPSQMFSTTPTATFYNPNVANAQVRDTSASADCSATAAAANRSDKSMSITCTGNAGTAVGNALDVFVTLEAEL